MKTIAEYLALPYKMEIEKDPYEGGYVISFPELPGCMTCAETWADVFDMAEDAKKSWMTAALEDGCDIPLPKELDDYSGQFKLRIPKSLHKSLAEGASREGISMNQYCLYLLSKNDALASRA